MIETAAIIPTYNECERIDPVIEAALRAKSIDTVVVVDDYSDDTTNVHVAELLKRNSGSKLQSYVKLPENRGKTEALKAGVTHAKMIGGTCLSPLVFLDADSSPIWSRDTRANMKLWQLGIHSLSSKRREPVSSAQLKGRENAFITLLATYIDEITEPVQSSQEIMRSGMYQRNVVTDTCLGLVGSGGHAGNRALSVELWDNLLEETASRGEHIDRWEIEGALNAYAKSQTGKQGSFIMYGVVNVGSRVKTGSMAAGLLRMGQIHHQAFRGNVKLR